MNKEKLQKILESHKLWLMGEGGERADLSYANLNGAKLSGACLSDVILSYANLHNADLYGANLSGACLCGANLSYANCSGANLRNADIKYADLSGVDLRGADIRGADFSGAYLRGADFSDVKGDEHTSFLALQCPEKGSFVAWKKCENNVLVKLLIPEDAKRSSSTSRKCRASKAMVLEVIGAEIAISTFDVSFVYEAGKEVVPDSFDDDRWNECSHGVHFFITRKEAEDY